MTMAASVLNAKTPYAITMWDFSWLERRWPGAGYEDWDLALDELKARGYNAVRIDAYPHLIAQEPAAHWTLYPEWNQHDWGSPTWITVQVQPGLNEFIAKAADRGIKVSFCGNINPMHIFLKGTPAQVYDATRHCMAIGGPRSFSAGGCEIPMPTPDANVYAQNRALASLSNGRATSEG
jgi:uroporphyrinogen-III decarboxylase